MDLVFHPLLHIDVGHEYVEEGGDAPLELVPTASTRAIMQHLDLRQKPSARSLEIFYGVRSGREAMVANTEQPVQLVFRLVPRDPRFINYTDLSPATLSDQSLLLTTPEVDGPLIAMEDAPYVPDKAPGDIGLVFANISKDLHPASYSLTFAARATVWRYLVIPSGGEAPEALTITDLNSGEIVGDAAQPATLPDGTTAQVITLSAPRKFTRRPSDQLQLSYSAGDQPATILLPSPDPAQLSAPDENGAFRSDVYIYL